LAGAQGFSTSEVGSTGISKSNAPVAITKISSPGSCSANRPPPCGPPALRPPDYQYGLLQRRRSGI
jgi:hypothetical protein